jgi:hypothetical protein
MLLGGLTAAIPAPALRQDRSPSPPTGRDIEEIYVVRAVRESRVAPTVFCDHKRTGFDRVLFEDRFSFRSIETRPTDGRVISAGGQMVGTMHVCFGATTDTATVGFHAEGTLADVPFVGRGECRTVKREFPEPGITVMRCYLDLDQLPTVFIGGQLTTNTVLSRAMVGAVSDPPGYTQPSIVTVRLWKHR